MGSNTEKEKYKKNIINKIDEKKIIDLMGKSITQTHAYMKRCNLFVGNDSGLMHLSAASKIPTIGLFGPTNNKLYSPYGNNCYTVQTKETYENFQTYELYRVTSADQDMINFTTTVSAYTIDTSSVSIKVTGGAIQDSVEHGG